jgi:hypothetical protein
MTAYNPPKIVHIGPVWKAIGEASASLDANGLWIEQVDGFRVAVRRYFPMPLDADMNYPGALLDAENQNRIQIDIMREAMRMNDERMGDRTYSDELRMRAQRLEDEANENRALSQRELFAYPDREPSLNPFMDFNW